MFTEEGILFTSDAVALKYTDPSCLYDNEAFVAAAQACGAWFVLMNGIIDDASVHQFLSRTRKSQLCGILNGVVIINWGISTDMLSTSQGIYQEKCS